MPRTLTVDGFAFSRSDSTISPSEGVEGEVEAMADESAMDLNQVHGIWGLVCSDQLLLK